MTTHYHKQRAPLGAAPGTLISHINASPASIDMITYGAECDPATIQSQHIDITDIANLPALPEQHCIRWINISGVGNAEHIQRIGEAFNLHPLMLEDIMNIYQRPKIENYDDWLFLVTRMPIYPQQTEEGNSFETEQVSLVIGKNILLTFQEEIAGDVFDPVRARLRHAGGRMRARGVDYLAYALLDATIDSFFPLLEHYGEWLEQLEQEVIERPDDKHIRHIHLLKRNLLTVRRAVWPQREMLSALSRDDSGLISDDTKIFLRDCYDHCIQLIDMIETFREIASGLVDIQLSSTSNHMNEVMKVLTIISTIFIPLSFVAGIYGMNFDTSVSAWNMPELGWKYGYPTVLIIMFTIAAVLLSWFYRKGWLRKN